MSNVTVHAGHKEATANGGVKRVAQPESIYTYILSEENRYKTQQIPIVDGYEWNMYDHIRKSTLYKNSQFIEGNTEDERDMKPYKNIIRPILNVAYRTEGFDVKDITPFADDEEDYWKTFLIKKFHDKWARENDIDTFIDEMVESYVDYGGALIKNVNGVRPEVVPLQRLAFVDQTDILAGAICEKHTFSIDQLDEKKGVWDVDGIDEAITMARADKTNSQSKDQKVKTPSKYIEVYEVHGIFPESFLKDDGDENKYSRQIHIVTYYKTDRDEDQGITLFKGKEKESIYKLILRDAIYGRALGFGGVEELFESQIWTNYSIISIKNMLDKASLMLTQTADTSFATKNKLSDLEQGEILIHKEGMPLTQVALSPVNIEQFEASITAWENHARTTGSATDAVLGLNPASGTPFKLQDLQLQQGNSLHDYRRGKLATFMGEIYRDWILKFLTQEINKGQKFLAELSLDELQEVTDKVVTNHVNGLVKQRILSGQLVFQDDIDAARDGAKAQFMKKGNKRFIELMKNELADTPVNVEVNVAGKQKDLGAMTDKLTNIFRQVIASPQVLQDPNMAKLFNQILEYSGLDPINFVPAKPVVSPIQNGVGGQQNAPQQVTPNQIPNSPASALA